MRNYTVAIQGSVSSFHDLAAKKFFGQEVDVLECGNFNEVCHKVSGNQVDYGIIAIENKIAGSILLNYQLIDSFNLNIIGETYLPIELHLLTLPGVELNEITEVISHPMALGQCQQFLNSLNGVKISEFKDTATSAQLLLDTQNRSLAVVAGTAVANHFNLKIVAPTISDEKYNFTRFYVLTKGIDHIENPDKASLTLTCKQRIGALSDLLQIFKSYEINLSKIQSIPIPNDSTRYAFHLDIEFDDLNKYNSAIKLVSKEADSIKVLGVYKSEKTPANTLNKKTQTHETEHH